MERLPKRFEEEVLRDKELYPFVKDNVFIKYTRSFLGIDHVSKYEIAGIGLEAILKKDKDFGDITIYWTEYFHIGIKSIFSGNLIDKDFCSVVFKAINHNRSSRDKCAYFLLNSIFFVYKSITIYKILKSYF